MSETMSRAEQIRAARESAQARQRHEFPLSATGGVALVRRLDLMAFAAMGAIPSTLQATVNDLVEAGVSDDPAALSPAAIIRMMGGGIAAVKRQQELADAFCLVGFLDPTLVPTTADITDPTTQLALEEIDPSDRLAYWAWCQGQEAAEAAAVAPLFPVPAATPVAPSPGDGVRGDAESLAHATGD